MTDETESIVAPPLVEGEKPEGGMLKFSDVGTNDPDVDVAFRWAQVYARDIEYEPFFEWIARRSNPERTDFRAILESLPLTWGPDDLPPPLRRHFIKRFGK